MPAAAAGSCPEGRSPSPGGSYAGSGRRRCVRMAYREAAPAVAGRCGTPDRRPLPDGSCKGGFPSCGGSGHTRDTEPPELAPRTQPDPPRSPGCPCLLLQRNSALARLSPAGMQSGWEGAHTLLSHKLQRLNRWRRGQMPPSGWWHITLWVRGQNKRVKQLFQKKKQDNKCWAFIHVANTLCTCAHVFAWDWGWHRVCVCVHVYVTAEIMYCCFCPLIWQYNLSFALACSNLPIPQRGNYLGLRQKEGTDQRKWAWESNRKGKWCRQDTEGSVDRWKKKKKKRSMGCENRYKGRIRIWNGREDERKGGEAKENAWYFWFRLGTVDELSLLYNGKRTRPKQSLEI